jgi:MbtH protein
MTYQDPSTTPAEPQFKVVVNHEEQYSIWPADQENPAGWTNVGPNGSREQCLADIAERWTDMRPLSLRRASSDTDAGRQST